MKRVLIFLIIIAGVCALPMVIANQFRGNSVIVESNAYSEQGVFLENPSPGHTTKTPDVEQGIRKYKSSYDFPLSDVEFSDKDVSTFLQNAFEQVNFYGRFETGDLNVYDYYKGNYLRLVNNEIPFTRKETGEQMYLIDFDGLIPADKTTTFTSDNYRYHFFDMDEDGTPELCINESHTSTYIFKYISDKDEFLLLYELHPSYYQLNGSNKIRWDGTGGSWDTHVFYKMDGECQEEYTVYFFTKGKRNEAGELEEICMIGLPHYSKKSEEIIIPEKIKKQAYFAESHQIYYFRVSEEEYNDLVYDYRKATELAKEKIKEVTYTYDELFGELVP